MSLPPKQVPPQKVPVRPSDCPVLPSISEIMQRHALSDLTNSPTSPHSRNSASPKTLPLSFESRQEHFNKRTSCQETSTLPLSTVTEGDDSRTFSSIYTRSIEVTQHPNRSYNQTDSQMNGTQTPSRPASQGSRKKGPAITIVRGRRNNVKRKRIKSAMGSSTIRAPAQPMRETPRSSSVGNFRPQDETLPDATAFLHKTGLPMQANAHESESADELASPNIPKTPWLTPRAAPPESEVMHQGRIWVRHGPLGFHKWRCSHGFICKTDLGNMFFLLDIDSNGQYLQNKSQSISLFLATARVGENKLKQGGFSYRFALFTPKRKYKMGVPTEDCRNDWIEGFAKLTLNLP